MRGVELRGATVVILGASSGIGRAAAVAFAREGANVVVAARRAGLLVEVAEECRRQGGGEALAVPTDITDAEAVLRLAETAAEHFAGRIDVWVNNAGVGAVGRFTETPIEAHDQTIRTNLMGYLHGAHAALPYMLRQRCGVLINTISFGAWVPAPYAVAYSASKYGLRGFSEALRAELQDYPGVHVCDVFPSFMDTPGVQHAGNYVGRSLKPPPGVYSPQRAARAMVRLARSPRGAVTIGSVATLARLGYALLPGFSRWAMMRFMQTYFARAQRVPRGSGNLFEPIEAGRGAEGGWRSPAERGLAAAALIAAATGIAYAMTRQQGRGRA